MRGILFQYDTPDALVQALEVTNDEQVLALPTTESLVEGEWLLSTFHVGTTSISLAGCAVDRGAGLCLSFAERDWQRLWDFAVGHVPSLIPSAGTRASLTHIEAPRNAQVLVVDDDDDLQRVLGDMLRASGFAVGYATSAEEALDRLRTAAVDLLVLDWNLPGMSGLELCVRLRRHPDYARLPVLFLTARSCMCDVVEAFDAGADDFVSKPFRGPELGARIHGLLRRSHLSTSPAS